MKNSLVHNTMLEVFCKGRILYTAQTHADQPISSSQVRGDAGVGVGDVWRSLRLRSEILLLSVSAQNAKNLGEAIDWKVPWILWRLVGSFHRSPWSGGLKWPLKRSWESPHTLLWQLWGECTYQPSFLSPLFLTICYLFNRNIRTEFPWLRSQELGGQVLSVNHVRPWMNHKSN